MIAKLTGKVIQTGTTWAILDVQGVGYLVQCSTQTLSQIDGEPGTVSLWIDTHVREDAIVLFGFLTQKEQDLFRLLTGVQGVGGKAGLSILSVHSADKLIRILAAEDAKSLTLADGIGAKIAGRIVNELKDKLAKKGLTTLAGTPSATTAIPVQTDAGAEAISALIHLGYPRFQAFNAVTTAVGDLGPDAPVEQLITQSLKTLSSTT
jgi:Holliday junction DNA helicase RuvA